MMGVLKENMIELDPDLLEDASGGLRTHMNRSCSKTKKCDEVCRDC